MATSVIQGIHQQYVTPITFTNLGNTVVVETDFASNVSANNTAYTKLGTVNSEFRPKTTKYIDASYGDQKQYAGTLRIRTNGDVEIATNTGSITSQRMWANGVYTL